MDVDIESAARRLVECFNGNPTTSLTEFRGEGLTIHCALLGNDRRSNALVNDGMATLIAACHSRFPGIRFQCTSVARSSDGFVSHWVGHWRPQGQRDRILLVPCSCRVRYAQHMRELWFTVDEYDVLLQLGRVCAAPGQSLGGSAAVNQLAAQSLREALVSGKAGAGHLGPEVDMHVNIETYRDIASGTQMDAVCLEGPGKIDQLLAYIRERFGRPLELVFKNGISQGHTTTFRGTIRAKIGAEMQRYDIVCGFVTPRDEVSECWVKITPPPTLRECLT